jgi:hypothetical protein
MAIEMIENQIQVQCIGGPIKDVLVTFNSQNNDKNLENIGSKKIMFQLPTSK